MTKLVISPQDNPYLNIAVENHLLSLPSDGDITLYLWRNRRTVVIGQCQNPYAECNIEQLESDGGYLMRRRTGGGAVFHDLGNLNFSFIVPYEMYDQARQSSVIQRALLHFGLNAEVSGRNDILCQGRKISGNAFAKGKHQRLHHGTLLIHTDIASIQKYLKVRPAKLHKHGVQSHQARVVNLSQLNPSITSETIVAPLVQAFEHTYGGPATLLPFDRLAATPEVQCLQAEFASPEWKYGRWQQFQAQKSASFDWGDVEISVSVDEPTSTLQSVHIASDTLLPDAIALAEALLCGASSLTPPALPPNIDAPTRDILHDIFSLLY